ncbi:hypothetical protein H257_12100 [Aphanomyces astaci]|uniref:Tc1-like transposase DDE domain-containing protein n=1 Tax=Aphanomyces astaci TaxID=112090 RepID=W4G213_APHAT|nr:hypothetical protein H257_12100 [Aphanomyces astaci]ETV73064.1 hypothetical protein H257_12100 [Aphanomyces astaci]|eukprot:XP_009837513.1 hypothetical protein H257_12100 [Aphanomyces astaci]
MDNQVHLHPFLRKVKLQRGAYKHVAEQLSLDPRTVGYIWRTFRDRGTTATKKRGKVGPKRAYTAEYCMSNNSCKRSQWINAPPSATLPQPPTRKVYLVPGEASPRRSWKSKRFIPKVMLLGTVARPRIDGDRSVVINGKIGMWPFVRLVPALRNSRNRPAGTMVTKLVNVDAAVYRDFVINKVVPAIKASFPSATKRVFLQHDKSTPHGSITDAVLESVSTDGWTFNMRKQPPNSPDLNVLGLGFFASIQSLQYKKMSRTVDDVVRNTMEAFDELTYDNWRACLSPFQAVMRLVLKHSGDNHFALPHLTKAALRRAGLLMSNVSCPVSLLL